MGSAECFFNEWFQIHCRSDKPYLRINPGGVEADEVLIIGDTTRFSPPSIEIRSNTSNMQVCEDTSKVIGANLTGTPFYYSDYNKYMLVGSGVVEVFRTNANGTNVTVGGCTSVSDGRRTGNDCFGVNCCQGYIGYGAQLPLKLDYSNSVVGKNSCASAFMAKSNWYPENTSLFSDPYADLINFSVPLLYLWAITNSTPGPGLENNQYCMLDDFEEWRRTSMDL